MNAREQKALDDVAQHGCHILHVVGEGDLPPFSYSIGIHRTCKAPELILVGLEQPISHWIVNEYSRRVQQGERFLVGAHVAGFLEGFEVTFREVHKSHYREYLGWGRWFYESEDFPVLQMIWPTTEGTWPWDANATPWLRAQQPVLDKEI